MQVDILTLFPEIFKGPFSESLLKKAQEKGLFNLNITNIRNFTEDKHKTADDSPFGGGPGMVMKIDPIYRVLVELQTSKSKPQISDSKPRIILMSPAGKTFTQEKAKELSQEKHLIIICGHYEGIDERIRSFITDEISIGDYVLTGGEIPAMAVVDAVVRLIPGVVKEAESIRNESHYDGLLDFPSYTRPEEYNGEKVPDALMSGHHKDISRWRRKKSLEKTLFVRPELLAKARLIETDHELLEEIINNA